MIFLISKGKIKRNKLRYTDERLQQKEVKCDFKRMIKQDQYLSLANYSVRTINK